jgi:DNA polymerase I-like protein with 3'-5' exonuclease and polymerase domains
MLSPFATKTSRNAPSTTKCIFGLSSWIRTLIQPPEGHSLAYIDYSQQEFAIAAALSRDKAMMEAYESGDPYLQFAKFAGAVPQDATKETHPKERDLYKTTILATQYCMGAKSLSARLQMSEREARKLLSHHREIFSTFWEWSDSVVDHAKYYGIIHTRLGWPLRVTSETKERTIRNFLMQGNGAEMLRLAICFAIEDDVRVVAPIHDAVLIEAPTSSL